MRKTTTFLITDTHFGVKNNSSTWLKSQMDFMYKQFIPELIKTPGRKRIIHLGDVFDSRSSISTMVAAQVQTLFKNLSNLVHPDGEIIIVCGNHDLYSPVDDKYCTLETILGGIERVKLVIRKPYIPEFQEVFIPWTVQQKEGISDLSLEYSGRVIYTHADIITGKPQLYATIFSGHLHTPYRNGYCQNLGSCYPLTFADSNRVRYFYKMDEDFNIEEIPNEYSIRFWRLKGEEILNDPRWDTIKPIDYIELYLDVALLSDETYKKRISQLTQKYKNLWVIPKHEQLEAVEINLDYDIDSIIMSLIPPELVEKFKIVQEKFNQE